MRAICLPQRNPILFLGVLFLQTDSSFEVRFLWMILFRAEAIFACSISKTDREDFNSSKESTISTSLSHNIPSEGISEQELTWVVNLFFQYIKGDGMVNLWNWTSDFCSLCCPTTRFCGISAGKKNWRPSSRHRRCSRAPNSFFTSCDSLPCTCLHWNRTYSTLIRKVKNSLIECDEYIGRGLPRTFPCVPDKFHVSSGMLRSRLNMDRGLGTTAGQLGTWKIFSTASRLYILKFSGIIHAIDPLLQLLYLWSEPLYRIMTSSQFLCTENSSTRNSWALFNSPISCILLIWVSRIAFFFHNLFFL